MSKKSGNLSEDILRKWKNAATAKNIPEIFYTELKTRVIKDLPNKNNYKMAVVFNPWRLKRPTINRGDECNLCRMVKEAEKDHVKNLFPDYFDDMIVTPNEFPPSEGAVLLIAKKEIPMHNTNNLNFLGEHGETLSKLFKFGNRFGYNIFHQTEGAGATIGIHEHFHGTTLYKLQEEIGELVGVDAAEIESVKGIKGVYTMPNFPFAHLIFDDKDAEKIVYLLKKLPSKLKSSLSNNSIPHTLSQCNKGILITPLQIDVGRSMGSERAPGYFFVNSPEEFENTTYESAMNFMKERFYPRDIGLESLL
ncbi:MAG: hypothetical protein NTZ83_04625 [Candidatus Pacearchaeota archaeon]|nr:hypothetical protein [Candidatus Pacearchaeota archaeon]